MTAVVKTQCPSCQAYFSVPQAQLNEPNARARCGRCQQIFLVNNHLVVYDDEQLTTNNVIINSHNQVPQSTENRLKNKIYSNKQDDIFSSDALIYDDMPVDQLEDTSVEHRSSDEMDAWFSPLDTMSITAPPNSEPSHQTITIDDSSNVWLEKLLEEQNSVIDTSTSIHTDNDTSTNIAALPNNHSNLNPKPMGKAQPRAYPVQNRLQTSAATVLWIAGCLVLVMLLFAQYVIFNLNHLIKNPAHAARLQAVCTIVACSLPSADMTTLGINNLMYRPSEIKVATEFSDISASLANQSVQAQLLPSLKVSIYDDSSLIGEFIALPKDYLASTQHRLLAEDSQSVMFTVPVASNQISQVIIDPIY